jgi:MFS superfamily sulfate permease-like transporter
MPVRRTPNWIALVAIAGLVVLAALWLHAVIANSARPGAYYGYRHHPESFVYPTEEVVTWSIAIAVETLAACVWLLLGRSPVAICAAAAAIFGVIVVFCIPLVMHAPPYYGGHLAFALLSALWLGLIVIVAGIVRLILRLLGRGARRDRDDDSDAAAPAT